MVNQSARVDWPKKKKEVFNFVISDWMMELFGMVCLAVLHPASRKFPFTIC
jgi:hypothetical protein